MIAVRMTFALCLTAALSSCNKLRHDGRRSCGLPEWMQKERPAVPVCPEGGVCGPDEKCYRNCSKDGRYTCPSGLECVALLQGCACGEDVPVTATAVCMYPAEEGLASRCSYRNVGGQWYPTAVSDAVRVLPCASDFDCPETETCDCHTKTCGVALGPHSYKRTIDSLIEHWRSDR
jgi:hypothetical protein